MRDSKKESHFDLVTVRRDGDVLWINDNIFWEIGAFRPNISDLLKEHREYRAKVHFDKENLTDGMIIIIPRMVKIKSDGDLYHFVNIR